MADATDYDPIPTAFLLVEKRRTGEPVWTAKWRSGDGSRTRRRLGVNAWVVPDDGGGWKPRAGRAPAGWITEFQARRRMSEFVREAEAELAAARAAEVRAAASTAVQPTFRALAHEWLDHLRVVQSAKPSTLRDYRSLLAEPGVPYARGTRVTHGRVMAAFGNSAAAEVTTADIERMLAAHAREGVGARSVNKHRQVVAAIFNYGLRPENRERWRLSENPAAAVAKRREDGPGPLEVFSVEQVEELARAAASGSWRSGPSGQEDQDRQLGEMLRIAAYTGLRLGELVTLRWGDVHWTDRVLVVERALSGTEEGRPKSRRARYVPLGDQALGALDRLSRRPNFTRKADYVFAGDAGDRLDPSAVRRRYKAARDTAHLPPLRFHDLRHTAGSLLTRVLDPVTVRDVLGHADLKTTERYLHAVRASRLADAATRAFTPKPAAGTHVATEEQAVGTSI